MTSKITSPGIYLDMDAETYFADPAPQPSLTQSIAKILINQSPAHARVEHPRLVTQEEAEEEEAEKYDKAKAIGNAAHALMIGRGKIIAEGCFDNWQKKDAKDFKAEALAAGKEPILSKHLAAAREMVKVARTQLDGMGMPEAFRDGDGEAVIAWEEHGIWFRTMLDWITPDRRLAYDFKTSGMSVSPNDIGRKAVDDGWDIQAAMHERALNRIDPDGAGRRRFRYIAQEHKKPYALTAIELPESWLTIGRQKLAVAINLWRTCITTGEWPGYGHHLVTPEYPGFHEHRWLERSMAMCDAGLWSMDDPVELGRSRIEPVKMIKELA